MLFVSALLAVLASSCGTSSTVPITGRKQNILVSDEQVLSLSNQQYQEYMKTAKPSTNATNTAMVKRVGQNLANAVVSYLQQNGMGAEVSQYKWEFNLVQDKSVNAFCMPGGKIVVFEGRLQVPTFSRLEPRYSASERLSAVQPIHAVRRVKPTAWD